MLNKTLLLIIFSFLTTLTKQTLDGIDVSTYQGTIDWDEVKKKKDFAIIRMGYGHSGKDDHYEKNYKNAKKAGVPIGAYLYAHAKTSSEATEEAKFALKLLKGKKFEWPIYYDIEGKALDGKVNDVVETFCTVLEKAKYYCGFYTSASPLNSKFNSKVKKKYAVWVAHYGVDKPGYDGNWGIWQYSSKGSVSGIKGNVDLDKGKINYEKSIKENHLNGY